MDAAGGDVALNRAIQFINISSMSRSEDNLPKWFVGMGGVAWRALALGALVYFADIVFRKLSAILVPFVVGGFIAATLAPLVRRFIGYGMARGVATLVSTVLVVVFVGGGLSFAGARLASEGVTLVSKVRSGWKLLSTRVGEWVPGVNGPSLRASVHEWLDGIGSDFEGVAAKLVLGATTLSSVLMAVVFAVVFAFYLLKDGPRLWRSVLDLVGDDGSGTLGRLGQASWETMGSYMQGVTVVGAANSLLTGLSLWLIGIPMVGPIMVLTFMGSYIPFFGAIIAVMVSALVALAHGSVLKATLAVAAGAGIQVMEGNVMQPAVFSRSVNLHPVVILFSVSAGAIVWGVFGAFFAVPLVATLSKAVGSIRESPNDPNAA